MDPLEKELHELTADDRVFKHHANVLKDAYDGIASSLGTHQCITGVLDPQPGVLKPATWRAFRDPGGAVAVRCKIPDSRVSLLMCSGSLEVFVEGFPLAYIIYRLQWVNDRTEWFPIQAWQPRGFIHPSFAPVHVLGAIEAVGECMTCYLQQAIPEHTPSSWMELVTKTPIVYRDMKTTPEMRSLFDLTTSQILNMSVMLKGGTLTAEAVQAERLRMASELKALLPKMH